MIDTVVCFKNFQIQRNSCSQYANKAPLNLQMMKSNCIRVIFSFLAVLAMTTYEDMELGGQGGHKQSLLYFRLQILSSSRVSLLKFCSSSTMAIWMILIQ